jgi:PAS domain-containing protein
MSAQKPLELILARNLLSSLSTAAFLVADDGALLYFNEAAGALIGRRFEDSGPMAASQWTQEFGPFDNEGDPIHYENTTLTAALRNNMPHHASFTIRIANGERQEIEASAIPIIGSGGKSGAIVIFWPVHHPQEVGVG